MIRALLAVALLASSSSSHALYANVTPPTGFSFTGGVLKYGGTPAAAINWVSGASGISTSTSFIGRTFTVPGTARIAPTAAKAIARAMLTNPAMRLAPMLTWAAAGLWLYDSLTQQFTVPAEPQLEYLWRSVSGEVTGMPTAIAACTALIPILDAAHVNSFVVKGVQDTLSNPDCFVDEYSPEGVLLQEDKRYGTVQRYANPEYGEEGGRRVATVEDADTLAETQPLPDAVANEAQKVMPLPIALPELQPLVQPIGQPRETPEGTVQDRVRITPANDEEAPWRVEETVETVPEGTDEETEGEEKPIDPCDEHPERVGCQVLEAPDDPGIPTETRSVVFEPESLGLPSGCPAPRTWSLHGWELTWGYAPLCDNAAAIRLALIACASLSALSLIVTTIGRS